MITYMGKSKTGTNVYLCGTSKDTKPTDTVCAGGVNIKITNASVFECIDNGEIYKFDEDSKTWNKVGSYSGGGGGLPSGDYNFLTE